MSILTYPLGFIGGGKEDFYNGVIENSLRSSDGDQAYFERVLGTPTSRHKMTLSAWIKLDSDYTAGGNDRTYFDWSTNATNFFGVYFGSYNFGFYLVSGGVDYAH